jgi:benzylsuccinate CoA-transferase BbsF subunit
MAGGGTPRIETNGRYPLAGIRVLDFTHVLAGPYCTLTLANFGADVVRVESNRHRDHTTRSTVGTIEGRTPAYLVTNRNKRSLTLDLKTEKGHQMAVRLASVADVVIDNFTAGVMQRLKLDYDSLSPLNPGLIVVSMSGYGNDGPRSRWASMNMNLQAYSGLMLSTGEEGDPPTAISNSWNDYIGGLHAAFAILEALRERQATGRGRGIDLAQFECSVSTLGGPLLYGIVNDDALPRRGNRSSSAAPQGVYRCAGEDEWCAISVQDGHQWKSLVTVLGELEWGDGERFATVSDRMQNHDEIDGRIEAWTSERTPVEVEQALLGAGVPAGRMRRIQALMDDPDGATVFRRLDTPKYGTVTVVDLPFPRSSVPRPNPQPAMEFGENTREVMGQWVGMTEAEIDEIMDEESFA